ncbi:MAG: DUF166 family protein [Candidatus Hermodarchaeota archaeon]
MQENLLKIESNLNEKDYKLGILYGKDPETEELASKFIGHLINDLKFCNACKISNQKTNCTQCRKYLKNHASKIYFYIKVPSASNKIGGDDYNFLSEEIPPIDFLLVIGINPSLLEKLPKYLRDKGVKAVIIPIENPKWVTPELQVKLIFEFDRYNIQAAFPKPFCSLSKEEDQYNKVGFHVTKERNYIDEFINYFRIGVPIISILMSNDGRSIEDACVIQSAPCGSTNFIVQNLKLKCFNKEYKDDFYLIEEINKAHYSYPCMASMYHDFILEDSIFQTSGYIIRNSIRCELYHAQHKRKPSLKIEEN